MCHRLDLDQELRLIGISGSKSVPGWPKLAVPVGRFAVAACSDAGASSYGLSGMEQTASPCFSLGSFAFAPGPCSLSGMGYRGLAA